MGRDETSSPVSPHESEFSAVGSTDVLDFVKTPLNACSLESFCHSAQNSDTGSRSSFTSDDVVPLCLGCYQLNESTGKREGRLDLFAVPVGYTNSEENHGSIERFSTPTSPPLTIISDEEGAPGVLDGKWSNHAVSLSSDGFQNYYATAHANGEIWVHKITSALSDNGHETGNEKTKSKNPFQAKLSGKSASPSANDGLCLALAWENKNPENEHDVGRIISSYSDGCTAVHRVRKRPTSSIEESLGSDSSELALELEHHWDSHKMFTCPAEVWCANFIDSNIVVTGGDEGSWKVWDLRESLYRPVHHGKNDFEAGVTVLSPHPRRPNILAIGSYDETVALFDLRQMTSAGEIPNKSPDKLHHSDSLGGGIWRCKWHPFEDNRLLVAAMHGGCVMGEYSGWTSATTGQEELGSNSIGFEVQKKFTLHESMAYGIDWIVHRWDYAGGTKKAEAAASCSFYDKAMYLWTTR